MDRRAFLAACGTASLGGCVIPGGSFGTRHVGGVECKPTTESQSSTPATKPNEVNGQWPTFQFDNRNTGFNPEAEGPRSCPGKLWQFRVSPAEETTDINYTIMTSPVVHEETVYACDNKNTLYALDARTGELEWTVELRGWYIYGPTYADGTLYLSSNRHLLAIDVESQTEQWARLPPSPDGPVDETVQGWMPASPVVHDGQVFAGTAHGVFCAFDASSGERQWYQSIPKRHPPLGGEGRSFDDGPRNVFSGQPAVHRGVVYVANQNGRLYAFDAKTGGQYWYYQPGDRLDYAPTVHEDTVYVTGAGGIYAVWLDDGTRRWWFGRDEDWITRGSPAIAGNRLVAVAGETQPERNFVALDKRSGELLWQTPARTSHFEAGPVIGGGTAVMGMRGGLFAVEVTTGQPLWRAQSEGIMETAILVDDMVIAGDDDGYVYALR